MVGGFLPGHLKKYAAHVKIGKNIPREYTRVKLPKISELPPPSWTYSFYEAIHHLDSQGTWGALGMQTKKNNQTPSPLGQATIFVWEKMLGEKNIPMVLGSTVAIMVSKTVCSEENTVLFEENMFWFFAVWEN